MSQSSAWSLKILHICELFLKSKSSFHDVDGLVVSYLYTLSLLSDNELKLFHNMLSQSNIVIKNLDQSLYGMIDFTKPDFSKTFFKLNVSETKSDVISRLNPLYYNISPNDKSIFDVMFMQNFLDTPTSLDTKFVCVNCKQICSIGLSLGSRGCKSHSGSKVKKVCYKRPMFNDSKHISQYHNSHDFLNSDRQVWSCCGTVVNYASNADKYGENTYQTIGCKNSDHWGPTAAQPLVYLTQQDLSFKTLGINDTYGHSGPVDSTRISFLGYMYLFQIKLFNNYSIEELVESLSNIIGCYIHGFDTYNLHNDSLLLFSQQIEERIKDKTEHPETFYISHKNDQTSGRAQDDYDPSFITVSKRSKYGVIIQNLNKRAFADLLIKIQTGDMDFDDNFKLTAFTTMNVVASFKINSNGLKVPLSEVSAKQNADINVDHVIFYLPRVDIRVSKMNKT